MAEYIETTIKESAENEKDKNKDPVKKNNSGAKHPIPTPGFHLESVIENGKWTGRVRIVPNQINSKP